MAFDVSRLVGRAVQTLVQDALPGRDVYYGEVDKPDAELTYPYLVLWPVPATRRRANLTGTIAAPDTRFQLTGVGRTVDETGWVLDQAGEALQGARLAVAGYKAGLVWQTQVDQPITENTDLYTPDGSPTYRGVAIFRVSLEPAPS